MNCLNKHSKLLLKNNFHSTSLTIDMTKTMKGVFMTISFSGSTKYGVR